jgi:hypothetical protein
MTDDELLILSEFANHYNPTGARAGREGWIAKHHRPVAAPTSENPEMWECDCPELPYSKSIWRILTPEQIRQKFAHLKHRRQPHDQSRPPGSQRAVSDESWEVGS